MHTPSLRRRVTLSGVAVVALLVIVVNVVAFVALRARLEQSRDEVLTARVELVRELDALVETEELVTRLRALDVPVVVTTTEGSVLESVPGASHRSATAGSGPDGGAAPSATRHLRLRDGAMAEVLTRRDEVDQVMRRILMLMVAGSVVGLGVVAVLLRRAAGVAMAPLGDVVDAAHRTTAGLPGERLDADDPGTELGRMAVAYDEMLDSLEDALEQARTAEERTRRFVDDAAHQLRTPLAGVRSSVESLSRASDADERDRLAANAVQEVARITRLVNGLLELARLDAGHIPDIAVGDLVAVCQDEVERAQTLAPGLTVRMRRVAAAVEIPIAERSIREVLANLLDNARRHARAHVWVDVDVRHGLVEVRVEDDGPGVPEPCRERIFDRFVSIDGRGGSGLGLAIGRMVARNHGGELVNDGTFVLRLPLQQPPGARDRHADAEVDPGGAAG